MVRKVIAGNANPVWLKNTEAEPGNVNIVSGNINVNNPGYILANATDARLTVDATVGGVQFGPIFGNATHVFFTVEEAQCRITFDGSAPTATNGHIYNEYDGGILSIEMITAARFIRTGGTSAIIHATPWVNKSV